MHPPSSIDYIMFKLQIHDSNMFQMRAFAQETVKSRFIQCVVVHDDGLKYFEVSIIVDITSFKYSSFCV